MQSLSPHSYWHETHSVWTPPPATYPPLAGEAAADVAVIGGGITGLTAALHLKGAGRRVIVLEAGRVGAGTTGGTSGHLDAFPDQGALRLIRDFGESDAREVTQARMAAIAQIAGWCREFAIDCDFRRVPAFLCSETPAGARRLQKEREAAATLGLTVSPLTANAARLPFPIAGGFRIENQARFHSLRYLSALAERVHGDGCTIYEQTRAQPPQPPQPSPDGSSCTIETTGGRGGRVRAEQVLVCTHSAFLGVSQFDMRIAPQQSYMLAVRVKNEFPDVLLWDDEQPYHYMRIASSNDPRLLLVGGEDHRTGQAGDERDAFGRLERYVRRRFEVERMEQQWSSELFEPADGLPFVGRVPLSRHLLIATGFSGTGLTFGTLAGRLLADLVLRRPSRIAEVLSPARIKPIAAGRALLAHNLDVARSFLGERLAGEAIASLAQVRRGEGRVVRYRRRQWAVFRDELGAVHVLSPVCTHMGCHVQWNEAERTWDCPCHGGRFSAFGERLYGPPAHDLQEQALEDL